MEDFKQFGIVPVGNDEINSLFSGYRSPYHKIAAMERAGNFIRLKNGLYVVSPEISGMALSLPLIANHLYGPSYVSMRWALRYYGLIPERVFIVESITIRRSKTYENSLATFQYTSCQDAYFHIGIRIVREDNCSFLMASPEKALCDLIVNTSRLRLRSLKSMRQYLEEDIRFDMEALAAFDCSILREISEVSPKKNEINNLIKVIENEQHI